jgi:hypothetical protein
MSPGETTAIAARVALKVGRGETIILAANRDYVASETLVSRWGLQGCSALFVSPAYRVGEATWTIRLARDG